MRPRTRSRKNWPQTTVPLDQKALGRDALVFIVNEENPVQSLTQQQLRDIYAGKITNWKEVGGADAAIVAFQRRGTPAARPCSRNC